VPTFTNISQIMIDHSRSQSTIPAKSCILMGQKV